MNGIFLWHEFMGRKIAQRRLSDFFIGSFQFFVGKSNLTCFANSYCKFDSDVVMMAPVHV